MSLHAVLRGSAGAFDSSHRVEGHARTKGLGTTRDGSRALRSRLPGAPVIGDLGPWVSERPVYLTRGMGVAALRSSPLRIGLVAPPSVQVPPPKYGGTELVIDQLARGLVAAGHEVTLFTTGDSTCPVDRRWIHREQLGTNVALLPALEHVKVAYEQLCDLDVIHDHTVLGPMWSHVRGTVTPVVTTAHLPFTPELAHMYRRVGTFAAVVAISHHQRATAPNVPVAAVIHHGIDVDAIRVGPGDCGYVLFLGRISADKGVHRAIAVARAAGRRLVIAAKMWQPEEFRYFADFVQPRLGPDVEYVGEVDAQQKFELLAGAEALVNPIGWPEPFGLVMIEALSAGTPVLAFAQGAAPEIVDHGRTGFLCADEADMAAKLRKVGDLDRAECRRDAEARFSTCRMVARHIALYSRVLAEGCSARHDLRSPSLVEVPHRSHGQLHTTVLAEPTDPQIHERV
jgi:glycosyltransferase involved in cell wall biosynthesis